MQSLDKIFNFFKNKKEEESEYYLALLLTDEKTSAVVLKEQLNQLQVIGKHEEFFPSSIETVELEELIRLIDKTISNAEEILPPDIETHKTVFGLKDTWIEEETKKIKKEYLIKLKKVCDTLDLTPIGFMVVTEAISNLLQEEEGAPLSAILAEIGTKIITLTLFRGGKVTERTEGQIEGSEAETVDKLLKNFTSAVLPARIILYDARESDRLSQRFIGHKWSKSLPFLHVPQIVALPEGSDARAVVFGAGSQMGLEVMGLKSISEENIKLDDKEETKQEPEEKSEEKKETVKENFGFVLDEDITRVKLYQEKTLSEDKQSSGLDFNQGNLGEHEEREEEIDKHRPKQKIQNIFAFFNKIRLPSISSFLDKGEKRFIFPLAILAGLIILGVGISYFYSSGIKANIILSLKPKMVDETTTITLSSTSSSDFSKDIIATKEITTTVKGEMTIDTTGKKDVGNKAKGTVTVYNNGSSIVKLENGTVIKSSNNLLFSLDKDVTVSSASGDIFSGTKPGTADVAVTAKDIGTDYNLPSGTKFTVGNNSNLAAKNDSAFSGGSKKQVQVVSKNDIAKLRADLPKSLENKAHAEITSKASDGEKVLPLILTVSLENEKFDKDVDAESKKIKLTVNVKFSGMTYQEQDLINYTKTFLKNKYSDDISFADNSIKTEIKDAIERKDKQIEATLAIIAGLLPNINVDEVANKVKGKSLKETKEMLSKLPQVTDTKINFSPNVFFLSNLFPKLPNQIKVEVHPE